MVQFRVKSLVKSLEIRSNKFRYDYIQKGEVNKGVTTQFDNPNNAVIVRDHPKSFPSYFDDIIFVINI